jgi:hypothetical protein
VRKRVGIWIAASAAAGAVAVGVPLGVAATARPGTSWPVITASRTQAPPGSWITLRGSGFRPHRELVIEECSRSFMIVPQGRCTTANAVRVRAGRDGGFTVRFRVSTCPGRYGAGSPVPARCYLGVPTARGVDTVRLRYSIRIQVPWHVAAGQWG